MWQTPKTNWQISIVNGVYVGDWFNAEDFNRIKNNIEYLYKIAVELYGRFYIHSIGDERTPNDFLYADEINKLEENFDTINNLSLKISYGESPVFYDNESTIDFNELNRLESAIYDLYNKLTNEYTGRRMFTWNFGMNGGL